MSEISSESNKTDHSLAVSPVKNEAKSSAISTSSSVSSSSSRIILPGQWTGLEDQTECPVCSDFLIGCIRMCTRGHSICQKCVEIINACPLCRKEMSQVRNYFLEYFMEHCTFKCKYNDQGCTAELSNMDYYAHTAKCHFREVSCKDICDDDSCDSITNFKGFLNHLNARHKIRIFKNGVDYCYRFRRDIGKIFQTPYACILFDGKTFFYNFATYPMSTDNGERVTFAVWWVSYFNPGLDTTKYKCKIRIESRKDKDLLMIWTGQVLDFRISPEDVIFENRCLTSTLPQLKKFCSDDETNPHYLYSHVENAEIMKVEETERPMLSDSTTEMIVLQTDEID